MRKTLFVLVTLLLAACAPEADENQVDYRFAAPQMSMDADQLARIPARLQELVDSDQIAGAVVVLARHDGIVLLEAVGYQDLETKAPMRTDAIFRMASVSKPVTAIGVMMLQEEGRLWTWDRLDKHLPEFSNLQTDPPSERAEPVTLQGLLTGTSGIGGGGYVEGFYGESLANVVASIASNPLGFPPNTRFRYSQAPFDILGRVIEVVSGASFEAFMQDRLFGPLGMGDSGFFVPPEKRARIPGFYRMEEGLLVENTSWECFCIDLPHEGRRFPAPAFGLYSTAEDLGALLQMMLNKGAYNGHRVLSQASITAMSTNQISESVRSQNVNAVRKPTWGFGWEVGYPGLGGPLASSRIYGHGGRSGVKIWVDPENDLAGAFLIHQTGSVRTSLTKAIIQMATAAVVDP